MGIGIWELGIILFILGGPVLLGIIFAIFLIFRASANRPGHSAQQTALEILEQRYARGEIDSEEFEERRRRLLHEP